MAAFTTKDPADRPAFMERWNRLLTDDTIMKKTVLFEDRVAGHVMSFTAPWSDYLEVSFWLGKEFWGRGIATKALDLFLGCQTMRPLHARAAKDNHASIRVLEKCGFKHQGADRGFANARDREIDEVVLNLAPDGGSSSLPSTQSAARY